MQGAVEAPKFNGPLRDVGPAIGLGLSDVRASEYADDFFTEGPVDDRDENKISALPSI